MHVVKLLYLLGSPWNLEWQLLIRNFLNLNRFFSFTIAIMNHKMDQVLVANQPQPNHYRFQKSFIFFMVWITGLCHWIHVVGDPDCLCHQRMKEASTVSRYLHVIGFHCNSSKDNSRPRILVFHNSCLWIHHLIVRPIIGSKETYDDETFVSDSWDYDLPINDSCGCPGL